MQVFHDNNWDFKSRTLFVGGERCSVALFKSFVEQRTLLKHWPCDGLFFSTSVANKTENLNIVFKLLKPMGENTIVSIADTSLKESE